MGLLDGKRLLITGVLTDASLAFAVARLAQEEGAEIVLSGAGRALSLTRRTARKLPQRARGARDRRHVARSARAPPATRWPRGGTGWTACCTPSASPRPTAWAAGCSPPTGRTSRSALQISTYSLKALVDAFLPLLKAAGADGGASVVGLDFDATVAWPVYDWMGVAKAGLESLSRYLAKELGPERHPGQPRAAGPVRTMAAKSIPGFSAFEDTWADRAPLGWDVHDADGGGQGLPRPLQRPLPHDHRGDPPRRRRRPRRRRLRLRPPTGALTRHAPDQVRAAR